MDDLNSSQNFKLNPFTTDIMDGIVLFTAVKNRKECLEESLKTWISYNQIDEIIIVDWSSDDSLIPFVKKYQNGKITLAIVPNQPRWVLSQAFNLAARLTSRSRILKMDADVKILPGFFEKHILEPGKFFTGNWKIAKDDNEKHLHGMSLMYRKDFFSVNGYNEFIKSYGWDDIDLYDRLEKQSLNRIDFDNETLLHIPHENRTSFQDHINFMQNINDSEKSLLNSLINRFLSSNKPWTTKENLLSFSVKISDDYTIYCNQSQMDQNLVPSDVLMRCESQAIIERFYELGAGLSKELLSDLTRVELISLLELFYSQQHSSLNSDLFSIIQKLHQRFKLEHKNC